MGRIFAFIMYIRIHVFKAGVIIDLLHLLLPIYLNTKYRGHTKTRFKHHDIEVKERKYCNILKWQYISMEH